jgi:hypothetical protein
MLLLIIGGIIAMAQRQESEQSIEAYLIKQVQQKLKGLCLKWVSPSHAGVPDRILLLPNGVTALVEVKTSYGRLSRLQVATHTKFYALGHKVHVVWNRKDVDALVESLAAPVSS